jgi:hypothetical protein
MLKDIDDIGTRWFMLLIELAAIGGLACLCCVFLYAMWCMDVIDIVQTNGIGLRRQQWQSKEWPKPSDARMIHGRWWVTNVEQIKNGTR